MEIEEAYRAIAAIGLDIFNTDEWDKIVIRSDVGESMASFQSSRVIGAQEISAKKVSSFNVSINASKAAICLRNNLLETTGERILGLTMTIDKNGTFNIEYSYDKPEGF